MDQDVLIVWLLFTGALGVSTMGFAVAWWGARQTARRLEKLVARAVGSEEPPPSEDRMERLERAVVSIEERLDQMQEGHEFLARLVAGRAKRPKQIPRVHSDV